MRRIPQTDLHVFPLCLGGNVFGWTADEAQSCAVLDRYYDAGGNFIDTADVYSAWLPGHSGGESETIIGRWLASRGRRGRVIVATKVGMLAGLKGLAPATIQAAADASLKRLGVSAIDLYYAHADDPETPVADTVGAFDALVRAGKVRHVAASNFTAPRLADALAAADRTGAARYVALQPHYNLVHRREFEAALQPLCAREEIACLPYFGLARGFLTGKYRPGTKVDSPRASGAEVYLNDAGLRVLGALDAIAHAHDVPLAAVALAWLAAKPTVVAPIASARSVAQLEELLPMATLQLSAEEMARLDAASAEPEP